MEKTGQCRCGTAIKIPNTQCLYECKSCHTKGVFLCHVIPEVSDPVMVRCKECKLAYSLFDCPQCEGTAVIKSFKPGHVYGCVCGFTATFVTCNMCTAMLCLPPKASYENVVIECKKCQNSFKYRLCQVCKECNFMKPDDIADNQRCFNELCINFNKKPTKVNARAYDVNVEQYNYQPRPEPLQKDTKCKICKIKQATMINNTCFHMSTCEACVDQLSLNRCPVCSANGEFRKVNF